MTDIENETELTVPEEAPATGSRSFGDSCRLMLRVLTFRASAPELITVNSYDLVLGLMCAWIVGIGRYWDNPRAEFLQQLGVGSVLYVFILTMFLFCLIVPMRPKNWHYFRMLVFVTFTSLPAMLYAIPVQMIFPEPGLKTANEINLVFLGIVSVWRVSLLLWYCKRVGELPYWASVVGTTFPILLVIFILTILNLDKVVFNIMSGIDQTQVSPNDDIYGVLMGITILTYFSFFPLLITYIVAIIIRYKQVGRD